MANLTPAQQSLAKGDELFQSSEYFDAARFYRRALELDSSLHRAFVYIGDCCAHLGDPFLALQFFFEALLHDRDDYLSWMLIGGTYFRLGRPDLARQFTSHALGLNPSNPRMLQTIALLPMAARSMRRYFEEQQVPTDPWTNLLDQQRTSALLADLRNVAASSWPRVLLFYREYLDPQRFQKLQKALGPSLGGKRLNQANAIGSDTLPDEAAALQQLLERVRPVVERLAPYAGVPLRYRFGAADGALVLKRRAVSNKLTKREKLIQNKSEALDDLERLRLEGFTKLKTFLRRIESTAQANSLIMHFTIALSDALAKRDLETAQSLAFGELELIMCFARRGLAESEKLPTGKGISVGAERMNTKRLTEAVQFVERAATSELVVRETEARGWHVESVLYAFFCSTGPQLYVLYLVDYPKAYDLSRKLVVLSELLPERLKRFPLRAFYRLQALASLVEAAAKLGLHEETIRAATAIADTIDQMGREWQRDLPQYPATLMRLGQARRPEQVMERAYEVMAAAYRSLGGGPQAASTTAKIARIASDLLMWRGRIAARDCLALMDELKREEDGLDGAFKFAYMALALDERKYREAGVQFHANRVLGGLMNEVGLPRLEMISWLRALAAAVEMNIPFNILSTLDSLGEVLEDQRDPAGAQYFYRKAVQRIEGLNPLQKSMLTTQPAIHSLFRLAVLVKNEAPEEARAMMERAIGVIETQREEIQEDLNAAGFGHAGSDIYAELVDLYLGSLKDENEALRVLERSKMRALLDQFARRAPSEQEFRPLRFDEIGDALQDPTNERQTILVELFWHDERLHTFVVQPDGLIRVFSIALSAQRLEAYVRSFRMAFAGNDRGERESGAWLDLSSSWLEGPLGELITRNSRIVFVPHGLFHHLPLHLLPFHGVPLTMTCPVSYCPSATLLVECRNRSRRLSKEQNDGRLLAIGVQFEDEARMVHATVKSSSLLLQSAAPIDKTALLSLMKDFRCIHFSCHGIFDVDQPMQSGLVLKDISGRRLTLDELRQHPDGYLTAAEISRSHTDARLVTLSACETAQIKDLPGDELLGLTRAFFLAGAGAVLVSFWPVPAGPTNDFMQNLYHRLVTKPIPLADAIQAAYISTAHQHPDPFNWGGFALVGDGVSSWKLH